MTDIMPRIGEGPDDSLALQTLLNGGSALLSNGEEFIALRDDGSIVIEDMDFRIGVAPNVEWAMANGHSVALRRNQFIGVGEFRAPLLDLTACRDGTPVVELTGNYFAPRYERFEGQDAADLAGEVFGLSFQSLSW